MYTRTYISLETVLKNEAVVFQYYDNIFLVGDASEEKKVGNISFTLSKIKESILLNPLGVIHKNHYAIATPERAICDRVYLSGEYYFDNLSQVDFVKLKEISLIYNKKTIILINELIQKYS